MSDKCQKCESTRLVMVSGKCSDRFWNSISEQSDYVPNDMGIGGQYGDYIEFTYCLDCGQIQGEWPLPQTGHEFAKEMSRY